MQDSYPGSRAARIANLAASQVLLQNRRPEAMLIYADGAMAGLKQTDPMRLEAEQLRQRAIQEIAAKHR